MAARRAPDSAIKLFGRTIPLLDSAAPTAGAAPEVSNKLADDGRSNYGIPCIPNKLSNVEASSFCSKNGNENGIQVISSQHGKMETDSKSEEVKTESDGSGQEEVLKKPDKILPCPRCNSMETKFCYFNNYNVNQPRHFCRNCQRYWTAGGTMRNVPVGAGRRRNKQPSHHRHAMMPCDGDVSNVSDATHHQSLPVESHVLPGPTKENERVTKSGFEVPLCKSEAPVLYNKEQSNTDLVSLTSGDNKEEKSCASSVAVSGCSENWMPENTVTKESNDVSGYCNGVSKPHLPSQSYPTGPTLVFPWSHGWNNVAVMAATQCSTPVHGLENGKASPLSLQPPPVMPAPGICAPVVPFPLVPPFWSCIPGWPNGTCSSPWPGSNGTALPSLPPNSTTCTGNNSTILGKHSREANSLEGEKARKNLWTPKALRIDDTEEAAKSSIWAALGIKPDEKGVFESFQSKVLKNGKPPQSPQALQANPAAFSRSQTFQEGLEERII